MFRGLGRSLTRGFGTFMGMDPILGPQLRALGQSQGQQMDSYQQPTLGLTKNSQSGPSGQYTDAYLRALDSQAPTQPTGFNPMGQAVNQRRLRIMTKGS